MKLGSGLLDDYTYTIENAWFSTDAAYNQGTSMMLFLEGTAVDAEGEIHEDHQERYSIGSDWSTFDGGKSVQSDKGSKFINKSSLYGRLITACIEDCGIEEILDKRTQDNGLTASMWIGMKFHMQETEIKFGKKLDPITRCMPVKFLGIEGQQTGTPQPISRRRRVEAPTTTQAPPSAPEQQAMTPATPDYQAARDAALAKVRANNAPSTSTDNPILNQLYSLAASKPSMEEFIDAAFELQEVQSDASLQELVVDTTPNGLYAQHHTG